jgi:cell division protein FtsW
MSQKQPVQPRTYRKAAQAPAKPSAPSRSAAPRAARGAVPASPKPPRAERSNVTNLADRRASAKSTESGKRFGGTRGVATGIAAVTQRTFAGQSMLFTMTAGVTAALVIFGLIMVLSASSIESIKQFGNPFGFEWKQVLFAALGGIALMTTSLLPVDWYHRNSTKLFYAGIALQALVFLPGIGISVNGNREWINLGPFTLQPGEFLKIFMILAMADYMSRREGWQGLPQYGIGALRFLIFAGAAIIFGKDMGTVMVLGIIALIMIWLGETYSRLMRGPLILAGVATFAGLFIGSTSRVARIGAWLNPGTDDQSNPYVWQSQHGFWALANSHIWGQGLGMSSLKWSWIPEVQNDYIFAIIGEELGILGALVTILLFIALGWLILQIAARAADRYSRLLCYGVASWIVLQACINIGVVLGLLPVLGVPLPLISYGGSSLIAAMGAIGVVLGVERQNHLDLDGGHRSGPRSRR